MENVERSKVSKNLLWITLLIISFRGILVPGGFGQRGIEGIIAAIHYARVKKVPFLGVCLGLQCAIIEFARSQLQWTNANSTEFDPKTDYPVVIDMPEHNPGKIFSVFFYHFVSIF